MTLFQRIMYGLNVLAVLALLFAYASPFVDPSITWFFSFFGLGYPILLVINVVFIVYWLISKPQYALFSVLFIVLGFKPFLRTVGLSNGNENAEGISVMSYNLGGTAYHFSGKDKKEKIKEFAALINKHDPDVICVQERREWMIPILDDILSGYSKYPLDSIRTCIYTNKKVARHGNIPFKTKAHNATWIDLNDGDKMYRIYGIHISSNLVTDLTEDISKVLDRSLRILDSYNEHSIYRCDQLDQIIEHAKKSPHSVLITGDFNDIPQSYVYRKIASEYCDAFLEYGKRLGTTYPARLPGLRIDYAFASENLEITDYRVIQSDLSDHYPILTTIN